ncbi:hypothetical protein [Allopusillimonas ginsengisoli]|uniref:hypothetical protein n=1 Tax=Allopusillimonas ginsengisoli TaxID=453575 RepID=UPI00101F8E46|nr:hypothetical protein [Allopusillimonas ginsengisoli]TEA79318.1 hypothetical protein ERE07_08075 [Allopusillimonas ginsengisoli]
MSKPDLTLSSKALETSFRSLLCIPSSPFHEFIDYRKLFFSSVFEQTWMFAAQKYENSGDSGFMVKLINFLPDINQKLFLSGYACERYALQASCDDRKTIELRKRKKQHQPNVDLRFSNCLAEFKASRINIEKYKNGAYAFLKGINDKPEKKKVPTRSTDLLDSWLMLPGSFGSGQRR